MRPASAENRTRHEGFANKAVIHGHAPNKSSFGNVKMSSRVSRLFHISYQSASGVAKILKKRGREMASTAKTIQSDT